MKTGRNADTKPYLPFYVDDWFASTRVRMMSMAQRCAYLELLFIQWREGSIPTAPAALERLFPGVSRADMAEVVLAFPGGKNERLEREREIVAEKIAGHRLGAERANAKRALTARSASSNRTHAEAEAEAEAEATPSEKRPRATRTGPHAELIQFWERRWLETRGVAYSVEAKDGVAVALVLKTAKGDTVEVRRRMEALLTSGDTWTAQNASLPMLRSRWNQLAVHVIPKSRSALQNTLDGIEAMTGKALKELG